MLQSLHSANPESDRDRLRVVWTVTEGFDLALAPPFPRFPAFERRSDCAAAALLRAFVLVCCKAPRPAASLGSGVVVSSVSGAGLSASFGSSASRSRGSIRAMSRRRRFLDLLPVLGGGDEGGVEGGSAPHEEGPVDADDDLLLEDGETTLK